MPRSATERAGIEANYKECAGRRTYDSCDTKIGDKLEKFGERSLRKLKFGGCNCTLNLNHRVTDVNRLWIMVRVWKRKFHFDGGKTEHL